jgi:hypothetical protein
MLPAPSLGIGWIAPPTLADPFLTFWNFLSGYGSVFSIQSTIFGILAGLFVLLGLASGEKPSPNHRIFLVGILLPLFLTWLVSFRRPVYVDRYFIVLLPFLIPLLASGAGWIFSSIQKYIPGRLALSLVALILLSVGILNSWQVHTDTKYRREQWQMLAEQVRAQSGARLPIWFQQPDSAVPFEYYYREPYVPIKSAIPPSCPQACWWILRQPYTPTHAFTQSVSISERPWLPELPPGCSILDRWDSPTGIGLWKVACR